MDALTIEQLSLSFGDFQVLSDISLAVARGQFVTLLGPSGCGKTTLLKSIAGFYTPDSGRILLDGKDVTDVPPERRDTTMCFQSYALFPHLNVAENIVFGLKQRRDPREVRDERMWEVARQVHLESQTAKLPSQLSGGQQQRVALARAMAMRSAVILFDEPLSNLDAKLRDQVRLEILQLQKNHGFTAIYVTHDQSEALAVSDVVIVLNNGKIVQMGTPQEIYERPVNRFVADFIGTANITEGRIVSKEGGNRYLLETRAGTMVVASEVEPPSQHVYVCWRPEDVVLTTEGEGENVVRSRVAVSVYQGSRTELVVELPGGNHPPVRIHVSPPRRLPIGETVAFRIPPERVRFLEAVQ